MAVVGCFKLFQDVGGCFRFVVGSLRCFECVQLFFISFQDVFRLLWCVVVCCNFLKGLKLCSAVFVGFQVVLVGCVCLCWVVFRSSCSFKLF